MNNYQIRYHSGKLLKALPSITAVASYVKKEDGEYIVRCVNGIATLKRLANAVAGGLYSASELVALAKDALTMIDVVENDVDCPKCGTAMIDVGEGQQCFRDHVEMPLPKIGDRIRLRHDVDRYPFFIAKEGAYGTVDEVTDQISVKMDDHLDSCEEWDNCVIWSPDNNMNGEPLAETFAYDVEVLKQIPSGDWPLADVEGRLNDKEWPCGMRVRFKRALVRDGSILACEGTLATVVWWSPDNAAVKLDRLATMHGDGEVIDWDHNAPLCIWDNVEEVTENQMCERCGEVETGAIKLCNDCATEMAAKSPLEEAQQQARLNEQARLQKHEIENRRRAAIVSELAKEIRAAGFTIKSHTVGAVRFGTAESPEMYFGTFGDGSNARIGINSLGAEAIAKDEPKAAVKKLLSVIASK